MERKDSGAARAGNDMDVDWTEGADHPCFFTNSDVNRSPFRVGTATLTLRGGMVSYGSPRGQFISRPSACSTALPGTEKYLAEAIKLSGIPREEIWITTKLPYVSLGAAASGVHGILWAHSYGRWNHPGLKTAEESLDSSLKNLDTSYVDLVRRERAYVPSGQADSMAVLASLAASRRVAG